VSSNLGRILVVDDDEIVRRTCERVLRHDGWTVVVAEDGKSALAFVSEYDGVIDCVLSDIKMPGIDGFALVDALRESDEDLPVLLMTGDPSLDGAVRALDSGAVSYISKPFAPEALAASVARAARRHGVARMRRNAEAFHRTLFPSGIDDRQELERRFQNALDTAWMAYQPIVDSSRGGVFAYEALLRTDEPSLRRPDVLIGAAERLDRVRELGRTVRSRVARQLPDAPPDAAIFVNVHGLELLDEALFDPRAELSRHASRIVLEITERIGLDEVAAPHRVAALRQLGYRIAIDDLGAGYAVLGALATLEPDIVKLDMSLVRDIETSPTKQRVVGALGTLCKELGSRVVAEGVESQAERHAITSAGIELIQGFLVGRPERHFAAAT